MTGIGPILVGHDGSGEAERACAWSARLAEALDERLIVGRAYAIGDFRGGPESAAAQVARNLEDLFSSANRWGLTSTRISKEVHSGKPGPALVRMARGEGVGLLAVGSHHGAQSGAVLGRVLQHVTFRSPAPVALVREPGGAVSTAPLVAAVDTSNVNLKPLEWAVNLAGRLSAPLHIVSVGADRSATEPPSPLVEQLEAADPSVEFHRLTGNPADEILAFAEGVDCSAVIIGQRRERNLSGRVLGSVAGSILRGNDRPTIVLGHD